MKMAIAIVFIFIFLIILKSPSSTISEIRSACTKNRKFSVKVYYLEIRLNVCLFFFILVHNLVFPVLMFSATKLVLCVTIFQIYHATISLGNATEIRISL